MTNHSKNLPGRFSALSDQTRVAMLQRLGEGEASVSTLAAPFDMALPTILAHLTVLEAAGLVVSEKRGRVRMVRLQPEALREAGDWLLGQAQQWEARMDGLDALALATDKEMKDD